jgi:peptide/nickel transport system substrate-binding protein
LVGILTLVALLATGISAGAKSASKPVRGGTLRLGFDLNFQNCIDPGQAYGLEQRDLDRNLVDSLTDQNASTGAIVPWLATSWKVNKTATQFTFQLRKGVTFNDGEKFNAAAVKTAYDNIFNLGALSPLAATYLAGYSGTTVLGPYEVQVKFKQPNSQFLQATATTVLGILSPNSYTYTPAQRCLGNKFWGSGPFALQSFTPGVSAVLVRRAGYSWPSSIETNKGPAYLDGITASWIPQASVLVGSLDSGQLDLAWPQVAVTSANQQLITGAGGSIFSHSYPGTTDLLLPNVSGGRVLSDPKVRQALQESINRAQIASTAFWSGYPVVDGVLENTTPGYVNESSLLKYNAKAAETLLTSDGWIPGSGGIRTKNGQPLVLTYAFTSPSPITDLLQAQLASVGIQLKETQVTFAQFSQLEQNTNGNYDLLEGFITRGDPSALASLFDTSTSAEAYVDQAQAPADAKKLSALFAAANAAIAPAKRAADFKQLQTLVLQEGVAFPLDERLEVEGLSKNVHGVGVTNEGLLIADNIWLSN